MPRFLMTSIASIVLAACGVETMEVMPDQAEEEIELIESEEAATIEPEKVSETEETATEIPAEQVEESTGVEDAEEIAVDELQVQNRERALNQLFFETHLEKDAHSYYFAETDSLDFVQIEVREIQEEAVHATLEGVYRYILETEEILMRDYLTGDFMPYEKME